MARKKAVPEKYDPNSYRVISQEAEVNLENRARNLSSFPGRDWFNVLGQRAGQRPSSEHRHNRPNPKNVSFLRQDVRLLNEPVCNVGTTSTQEQQARWWPHRTSETPLGEPDYTRDTTMRDDFRAQDADAIARQTRHGMNPNQEPARGAIPVNFLRKPDGKQKFWKEGISYEHQYNSRLDPQYPVRGKRHGSFVWDEIPQVHVDKMLHEFGYISERLQDTDPYAHLKNSGKKSRKDSCSKVIPHGKQSENVHLPPVAAV